MAHWLDESAQHIKQRDPSRAVSSFVGAVCGFHSMWDFANVTQRLDISLANSPHIEINGVQTPIGGKDLTHATFLMDLARKYNKPITANDFVDFPNGLYSGFEPVYRGALATVKHGANGLYACLWYLPGCLPYSYSVTMSKPDRDRITADTKSAIEVLKGYHLQTKVAFIEPIMSYSLADEGGYKGDEIDSGGLYHLVLDLGLIPDVMTPYEIAMQRRDLSKNI